jgi:RNA polymerase primary sigma factor
MASGDEMQIYRKEIGKYPLLSADEEKDLATKIKLGDRQALEQLIKCNLRLVLTVAGRYTGAMQQSASISFDDLIQEGNIGLMKAAQNFDAERGVRFAAYAAVAIKNQIITTFQNQWQNIRLPVRVVDTLSKSNKAADKLRQILSRQPTEQEIANFMGLPTKKIARLYRLKFMTEDDNFIENDKTKNTVLDNTADPNAVSTEDEALNNVIYESLTSQMKTALKEKEQFVLRERLRYNANGEQKTLQEVGADIGKTRQWVQKLEKRAHRKLRILNLGPEEAAAKERQL